MRLQKLSFKILFLFLIVVFVINVPDAETGHNWNIVQLHHQTQDASISVYSAFSFVYQSVILLEQGNVMGANALWKQKVLNNIVAAKNIYTKYTLSLSDEYRDVMKNVPVDVEPRIRNDLARYGVAVPRSLRDLAVIAESELGEMEKVFSEVKFEENEMINRELLRTINERISRFINLGISFSIISAWNE